MSQFVLVKDVESGKVRKIAVNSIIPEGTQIAGVYFGKHGVIAVCEEASQWFANAEDIGSWANGPARFLFHSSEEGGVRLGKIGEYRPAADEYPVAVVYGVDLMGSVLTYSAVEKLPVIYLVFLDLITYFPIRVD